MIAELIFLNLLPATSFFRIHHTLNEFHDEDFAFVAHVSICIWSATFFHPKGATLYVSKSHAFSLKQATKFNFKTARVLHKKAIVLQW